MAEAVFNIAADIIPEIDDRELERQASLLSRQLNGLLAKNIKKVDISPTTSGGGFKPFQQQINTANNLVDKFHQGVAKLPITQVAKAGSNAFLKFTDIIDISRRDLVGYGKSMFDTIRDTHRFKDAMEGIQDASSTIGDLPKRFEFMGAQIRSGTSLVDRLADRGDRMAQMFQPVIREAEASRTEFVELNRSIDTLVGAVRTLGSASQRTGSIIKDQAGQTPFNNQILEMEKLKKLVPQNSQLFKDISGSIEQADSSGTLAGVLQELNDIKKQAQLSTGVIGKFQQVLNEKSGGKLFPEATKAARELQIAVEQGAIDAIIKVGGKSTLGPIERLNADLRSAGRTAVTVAHGFEFVRTNLAKILPGSSPIGKLVDSIADASANFKTFRSVGIGALDAVRASAGLAFDKFKSTTGLDEGIKVIKAMDAAATKLVSTIGVGLQGAFNRSVVSLQQLGNTPFGQRVIAGLAGINSALDAVGRGVRGTVATFVREFGKTVVTAFTPVKQAAAQAFSFVSDQGLKAFTAVKGVIGDVSRSLSLAGAINLSVIGQRLADSLGPATEKVARLGAAIKNAVSGGGGGGGGAAAASATAATSAASGLAEKFAAARDRAGELVRKLSLAGAINLSAVGKSLTDGLNRASEDVGRLGATISNNLSKAITFVADGSLTNSIGKFFNNVQQSITTRFSALRASGEQSGQEIAAGLAMGMTTRGQSILQKATSGIFNTVLGGIKTLFGIHSPAEALVPPGKEVPAGFAKGILQGQAKVDAAVKGLTKGLSKLKGNVAGLVKSGIAVAGVALAGLGATALHAGIEFNTLQQVVGGTLPVLVGSKAAAAGLLKEVNALNNSSPFARSSFLQLTQTLAGFGVQAKKITPLIDAIQQTVAATGGGEGDLQELGGAFAKIQSQGRLSLDILQSFSVRGVDAIGILGQSFGKTTSEVRDMISNGLIPANKAIDALTTGLKTRFDGATAAVSKNLPGALDRIKGKLRDMGAELTRAFVNPEGGGALVDFLNSISSAMVHINNDLLPKFRPLLEIVALGFTNLGKAVSNFVLSIQSSAIPGFIDRMASIAPTLAVLVGFFPKVFEFIPVIGPKLALLANPITAVALALTVLSLQSSKVKEALRPIIDNMKTLFSVIVPIISNVLPKLQNLFADLVVAIAPLVGDIAAGLIPLVIKIGETIGIWAEKLKPVVAAIGELINSLRPAVTMAFQFAQGLLNVTQIAAGPIATALVKVAQLLTKIAPIVNALIVRLVAMKAIGAIITFLNGGFQKMLESLIRLTAAIPLVETALTALGVSAQAAATALSGILGVAGLIAAGIALFIQLKNHGDKGAQSLDKLGDAALSLNEKFKLAFNTKDIEVFSTAISELQARADDLSVGVQPGTSKNAFENAANDGDNDLNVILAAEAQQNLTEAIKKKEEALKRAKEAGQKGLIVEFQQQVNAKRNGEFLIKDAALRDELNAAVLQGAEDQVHANAVQEESQGILQKLSDKLKAGKLHQTDLQAAAEASAAAIKDKYMEANKAVQDANAALSGAIDSLKQGLSTIDSKLNAVFSAAKNAQDATKAVTTAREKEADVNKDLAKSQEEYTKAIRDAIDPVDELNKALREQTRVKNSIRDLDQELEKLTDDDRKLQEDRLKLTGQEAADDRAGLVRAEQRAQISLNQAKQAELDLLNELNGANKVSINLAGLSLDQIRAKLAAARLSSPRERKRTAQEIADAKESANLDVQDAEQAKKDATQAKADFEIDTKEKIKDIDISLRENDERRAELQDDRLDKLIDEQDAQKTVNKLRAGETTLAAIIKDNDEKIAEFKERQKDAAEAITTAVTAEKLAKAELVFATATIRSDTQGMATAQQTIWNLKADGLNNLDPKTLTAIGNQKSQVSQLLDEYKKITAEVERTIKLQTQASDFQKAGIALGSFETLSAANTADINAGRGLNPITLANIERTKKDVLAGIRAAIEAGGAENKASKTPFIPQGNQTNLIMAAINSEYMKPNANLRDAIARALNSFGLSMPGFAAARGLSPGMIHPGMHNGKGLVRMFEFGKEAVLPLTRPQDMSRIVNDPRVLPSVLKALPGFASGFAPGDDIVMHALSTPNSALRKLLQDLFRQMGLQFPGFAEGYAPGDLSTGRSFKPFSVSDFAGSNLSPMLNSLPRWSMPQNGAKVSLDSSTSNDLSTVIRSARTSGRPANADVYEKKSQREFANTIGEAVRTAVKSAIDESGGLGGDDIDIHVNPNASETQRAIAREVKRQLDKRTGKW